MHFPVLRPLSESSTPGLAASGRPSSPRAPRRIRGVPALLMGCALGLIVGIVEGQTPTETEIQKLVASDASFLAGFGRTVAISGAHALVTADADADRGAAYVFEWDGSAWVQTHKLTASDGAAGDLFGNSGTIVGDRIFLSAPWDDDLGAQAGSAYVFDYDATTDQWIETAKVTASDGATGDWFGWSLAATSDTLVIGAVNDDDQGADSGATYVFEFSGTDWVETQKLLGSTAGAGDSVGWELAIEGDVILTSTVTDDDAGNDAGAVYVFRNGPGGWVEEAKLTASDGAPADWFGWGLSMDADVIAVGANHDDAPAVDSGSAYVFRYDGTSWQEEQKLTLAVAHQYDAFGWSTAVQGDDLVVGAAGYLGGAGEGAVVHFHYDGATWVEQTIWIASDPAGGFDDDLGFSVAVDGMHVLSGAVWASSPGGGDTGAAYYYQLPVAGAQYRRGDANGDGALDISDAVYTLSALFVPGSPQSECEDASDANDDGSLDISDAVYTLSSLFIPGSPAPPAPGPDSCGGDPTDDALTCALSPACP